MEKEATSSSVSVVEGVHGWRRRRVEQPGGGEDRWRRNAAAF